MWQKIIPSILYVGKGYMHFTFYVRIGQDVGKMWGHTYSTCIYQCFALYHQFYATYRA
jgi:hypothetical protein